MNRLVEANNNDFNNPDNDNTDAFITRYFIQQGKQFAISPQFEVNKLYEMIEFNIEPPLPSGLVLDVHTGSITGLPNSNDDDNGTGGNDGSVDMQMFVIQLTIDSNSRNMIEQS